MKKIILNICFLMILPLCLVLPVKAQQLEGAVITYQGSLKDGNAPANGNYEIKVEYFDAATGGASLGSITYPNLPVVNGIFSLTFNGSINWMFPGRDLWIETSVRPAGSSSPATTLAPRERITSAPFAISSLLSANSNRLGGIEANQYLTTSSGGTVFIQNGTTPQTGGFNLNGTGTANILDATTQFNLGGNRILSAGGANNIFAGFQAGQANTTGGSNSFFGVQAGGGNLTGNFNSFFGKLSGFSNTSGGANSFFGASSGQNNTSGGNNAFFGDSSGLSNTVGGGNTILGVGANVTLNNLTNATAIGFRAAVGQSNSLVLGSINGVNNSLADTNVGIGTITPTQRLQVVGNALFSGFVGIGLTNPTYKFQVTDAGNNGLRVLTQTAGGNVASFGGLGSFVVDTVATAGGRLTILENGNAGFGTNSPAARLSVSGGGFGANLFVTDSNVTATTFDLGNTSVGGRTWRFQSMGSSDASRTGNLELWNVGGNFAFGVALNGNVGFGTFQPQSRVHVAGGLTVNGRINYFDTTGNANFYMKSAGAANGINFGVVGNANSNSTLYISQYDGVTYQDRIILDGNGNITMPNSSVTIGTVSQPDVRVTVYGSVGSYTGGAVGVVSACFGPLQPDVTRLIVGCSSSIRYKQNIQNYTPGLDLVRRLRPVSFNWKANNDADFGLVAEEVAEVEPLLTTRNEKGEIQGVKYDRVGVVLVNAVGEQQTQIESQQKQIDSQAETIRQQQERLDKQQSEIEALKAIVCAANKTAQICREEKP
ncbi:MAG TPA: tail fiber domain-containing protein [Pyrinomonadaceae bacterium]|nr:tail fiber domain-containing protein [Pyrinomonadaceae bacterium]